MFTFEIVTTDPIIAYMDQGEREAKQREREVTARFEAFKIKMAQEKKWRSQTAIILSR